MNAHRVRQVRAVCAQQPCMRHGARAEQRVGTGGQCSSQTNHLSIHNPGAGIQIMSSVTGRQRIQYRLLNDQNGMFHSGRWYLGKAVFRLVERQLSYPRMSCPEHIMVYHRQVINRWHSPGML